MQISCLVWFGPEQIGAVTDSDPEQWQSDHTITSFFRDMSQTVEKCPTSQCSRALLETPGSTLSKFNQFFLIHRYMYGKRSDHKFLGEKSQCGEK